MNTNHMESVTGCEVVTAYKLFNLRKDGSIGPLFINRKLRIPVGKWIIAENHQTKGYAKRPGWHASILPKAAHLAQGSKISRGSRVWGRVELTGVKQWRRPSFQGGMWYIAERMRVLELLTYDQVNIILQQQ